MIGSIARVAVAEGLASVGRRAADRLTEGLRRQLLLLRGNRGRGRQCAVLNASALAPSARLGGLPLQLRARLSEERSLRHVAFLHPGTLEAGGGAVRTARFGATSAAVDPAFESAVDEAMAFTGARALHVEGLAGLPLDSLHRLADRGVELIVSLHDFAAFCPLPHLLESSTGEFCEYSTDAERCGRCLSHVSRGDAATLTARRRSARTLLERALAVVVPSAFLRDRHRDLFALPHLAAVVIEPGLDLHPLGRRPTHEGLRIAFAGNVQRQKGAHLLIETIRACPREDVRFHVFGGGDALLLRSLRSLPRISVHGYYRGGSLPRLLTRHAIDLVLLPSIVPESFGLTLSECWHAGVPAAVFDHGAMAERIGREGGGWVLPRSGAALAGFVERWCADPVELPVPALVPTGEDAARKHVALYRELGLHDA